MLTLKVNIIELNEKQQLSINEIGNNIWIASEAQKKKYEIIDQANTLQTKGIIVLNCIPVHDEKRRRFEERFLNRPRLIENEPGFVAIRVLRPVQDDIYIVLTQWQTEEAFRNWQASTGYQHAHRKRKTQQGIDQETGVLKNKPYHKLYRPITN